MERRYWQEVPSPIGPLTLVSDGTHLIELQMRPAAEALARRGPDWHESAAALRGARAQLNAYFAGELHTFELPLRPAGTAFQRNVWAALARIPFGTTTSYGAIANAVGAPGSARAVGAANGRNPIAIVVPCHRVIGADGRLVGYGGGLERKQWLLIHEARTTGGVEQLRLV
jgi:methylated-DNA-[protein]-cysteine S-methyltransferase